MSGRSHAAAALVGALLLGRGAAATPGCPADCAAPPDNVADVIDMLALLAQWGTAGTCDLQDADGVNTLDLLVLLSQWGPCPLLGACCTAPGACSVTAPADCAAGGGVFAGLGTICADFDGDRIPDAFELGDCAGSGPCFAGSNPQLTDTDGDGIDDGDEFYGTTGGLDLPLLGANPCHKDIFVELDWVYGTGMAQDKDKPHVNQVNRVVAAFAAAPVANPDGVPGIALHLDYGQPPYGGGSAVPDPSGNDTVDVASFQFNGGEFFTIKFLHFAANRNGYFHYCPMGDKYSVAGAYQNSSGLAELPGDDCMVTMGQWATGNSDFIGNTIMHELGHNLALQHGGFEPRNFKPNYNSVMNYWYQFCGTDLDFDVIPDNGLDYSLGVNIALNESNLVEAAGVTGTGPGIDWNQDGDALDTLARNINCRLTNTFANSVCINHMQQTQPCGSAGECYDASCNVLGDHADWVGVQLNHLDDADLAGQVVHCLLDRDAVVVRRAP